MDIILPKIIHAYHVTQIVKHVMIIPNIIVHRVMKILPLKMVIASH